MANLLGGIWGGDVISIGLFVFVNNGFGMYEVMYFIFGVICFNEVIFDIQVFFGLMIVINFGQFFCLEGLLVILIVIFLGGIWGGVVIFFGQVNF